MSSERRIQASRANGARSRGPKTPAGKERSARNSLRHGILARTVVLQEEDASAFVALLASLEAALSPRDQWELACVESMAIARWRSMRIWGMETAGLQLEIARQDNPDLSPPARAALAFRALSDSSRSLDLLGRYETRYDRQFARALNLLRKGKFPNEPRLPNNHPLPDPPAAP